MVRYLIAVRSISGQIKKRPLELSYLGTGLAGLNPDPPKEVRSLLAMHVSDYDDMVTKYAKKKSSQHGFELKTGEIEAYDGDNWSLDDRTPVHLRDNHRPAKSALDNGVAKFAELRIWVLAEDRNSRRRIVELKQYAKLGNRLR